MKKILQFLICGGVVYTYGATGTLNNDVNIREFPSMESKVVAKKKKGRTFEILEKVDTPTQGVWYQTPKGYIYETFVTLNEETSRNHPFDNPLYIDARRLNPNEKSVLLEDENGNIYSKNTVSLKNSEMKISNIELSPIVDANKTTIVQEQNLSNTHNDLNGTKGFQPQDSKEIILNDYTQALKLYKKREYKESYTILNQLFEKNLNDTNVDFYLGRSAFEIGLYDEAILAFNRILFDKPDTLRVQFELGRVYMAKKDYLSAKGYFTDLVHNPNTPNDLKNESQKYLDFIDEKITKSKFSGVFIFGVNYDSNINQRAKYDYFDIPLIGQIPNTTKDEGGSAHQEILVGNYSYKLNEKMLFKTDGVAFGKFMFNNDLNDKNIKMVSLSPSLSHQYKENLVFDYGVFIDNLWMGSDNYMQSYGIIPKVSFFKDKQTTIDGQLKYQFKKYQQAINKTNDSKYLELSAKYSFIYNNIMTFIPSIIVSNDKADDSSSTGVDNDSYTVGLDSNFIYSPKLFFTPSVNYKNTKYDIRDEKQIFIKLGSTYVYSPNWIVQGDVSYTTQDSNDQPYSYTKYNLGINLIRPF